jgi:protein-tyrosine kinase
MSRVDEAMRRATESSADVEQEALALAREPFPVEVPDQFRPLGERPNTALSVGEPPISSDNGVAAQESADGPSIPYGDQVAEKIVIDPRMPAISREQYRRVAAVLHDSQAVNRTQVVMVTSAVAGEGKTLTAANVALTLSNSYRKRVLVIDADLRRPALHHVFRIETAYGLADGLNSSAEARIVVRQVTPTLSLLPAGRPTSDPMAGLISERMRRLVEEARELFDWVIIDTPPLMLLPDANLLVSMADGVLLVVRAESTTHPMVKRAVDAVGRPRILGVVLNSATVGPHGGYRGPSDYYYVGSGQAVARS